MTLILKDIIDIDEVSFKDMVEFKEIIKANVEFLKEKSNGVSDLAEERGPMAENYACI